ncbi:nck-associated protein 5-like [Platichthys flesus]|uniref:nck-associated protein 5-like n=1 Tax=Platichthys flesus TaxID=8260 RepID=UPI002DBA94DA|nr:nck-associated protein 5-like [Platichthys flesus]
MIQKQSTLQRLIHNNNPQLESKQHLGVERRERDKSQQGWQQMVTLQQHFSSMEETVRTLLQNQDSLEGPKVDPLDLMKAYKDKLLEEMWKQQDSLEGSTATAAEMATSPEASGGSEENSKDSNPLLERLRALEAENSALSIENDNQRKQYERCLDEVGLSVLSIPSSLCFFVILSFSFLLVMKTVYITNRIN